MNLGNEGSDDFLLAYSYRKWLVIDGEVWINSSGVINNDSERCIERTVILDNFRGDSISGSMSKRRSRCRMVVTKLSLVRKTRFHSLANEFRALFRGKQGFQCAVCSFQREVEAHTHTRGGIVLHGWCRLAFDCGTRGLRPFG